MKKVAFFLLLSLGVFIQSSAQQVAIFSGQDTIELDQSSYSANIRVANFQQIVGAQFTLRWDTTVLNFSDITDIGSEIINYDDHFGRDATTNGVLRFAWFNNALVGINLPDSATLFKVKFDVVGGSAMSSPIAFTDDPTTKEVYDTTFSIIPSQFQDGSVSIASAGTVSNTRQQADELNILAISPNPARMDAGLNPSLKFFIKDSDTITIRIVSINGQEIARQQGFYQKGAHQIEIENNIFKNAGTYLIHVESARFYSVQKVIIQQ